MVMAAAAAPMFGRVAPKRSPIARFVLPAMTPLRVAIWRGSLADTSWVRLLSRAQHAHAPAIANAPQVKPTSPPCQETRTPPPRINARPIPTRKLNPSWKASQAMSAVKTTSRLSSKEALAAGVDRRPITKRTGPSPPPNTIAPDSAGNSRRVSGASRRAGHQRIDVHNASPLPR